MSVTDDLEKLVIDPSLTMVSSYHDAGSCWELIDAAVIEIRRLRSMVHGLADGKQLGPVSGAATILAQELELKQLRTRLETLHKQLKLKE